MDYLIASMSSLFPSTTTHEFNKQHSNAPSPSPRVPKSTRLLDLAERASKNGYFVSLGRGLVLPFPLMMLGAIALLLRYPPMAWTHQAFSTDFVQKIELLCDTIISGTFGVAVLIALGGFSHSFTQLHNKRNPREQTNPAVTAAIVVACFMIIILPANGEPLQNVLSLSRSLLCACLVSTLAAIMFLKLSKRAFLQLPKSTLGTNPLVGDVLDSLPAAMITLLTFALVKTGLILAGFADLTSVLSELIASPFIGLENGLALALIYEALAQILWFFGMHGPSILSSVADHHFIPASIANNAAMLEGAEPVHIITSQFFDIFVRMGGSGSTLCLILALLFLSNKSTNRRLALLAFLPALCNINEPMLFGIPLVLNPLFVIPFILVPLVQIVITYVSMAAELLPMTSHQTTWTTPALISGYVVTGNAPSGALLQLVNIFVGTAVYYPFARLSERLSERKNKNTLVKLLDAAEAPSPHILSAKLSGLGGEEGRMAIILAEDFTKALRAHDELYLEYQPQIDIDSRRVIGAEALLRWHHPQYGRIAPPIIVALAEDLGLISELGYKVIELACRQRMSWQSSLPRDFRISVNVSPKQLVHGDFDERVRQILRFYSMPAKWLELELTETTALLPEMHSIDCLARLRQLGVKIALDDFGMGHTSLHYLRFLPLDTVKIDRSLTTENAINEQIVKSIHDLTTSLGMSTIVEGIESEGQVKLFHSMGYSTFQGYFFSRPLPYGNLLGFVENFGAALEEMETDKLVSDLRSIHARMAEKQKGPVSHQTEPKVASQA